LLRVHHRFHIMIGATLPILLNNICMISIILLKKLLAHNEDTLGNPHPDHTAASQQLVHKGWGNEE